LRFQNSHWESRSITPITHLFQHQLFWFLFPLPLPV
jgi:hypothetical protein